jgi:hypothetical protein
VQGLITGFATGDPSAIQMRRGLSPLPVSGASWAYDFTNANTLAVVNGRIAYAEDVTASRRPFASSSRDCRPAFDTSGAFSFAKFTGSTTHDTGLVAPLASRVDEPSFTFVFAWRSPVSAQHPLVSNYSTPPSPSGNGTQVLFGKNSTGGPTLFVYQAAEGVNPFIVSSGSYGSGWIVAMWRQDADVSRSVFVDATEAIGATPYTKHRAFLDLLQWCREGTSASDFDVAFAACFPRDLTVGERATMRTYAASKCGRVL